MMMTNSLAENRLHLWCIRVSGRILFVTFALGWIAFAHFIPAPSPLDGPEVVASRYIENQHGIQIGATLMMLSFAFWAPWGAVVADWTRRSPGGGQILATVQVVSLTISEMIGVLCAFFWALAAFRPDQIDTDITMVLNDAAWLMFLLPWPPFSAWCIGVAVAVFRDVREGDDRTFPRWTGYLSLLTAVLFVPAGAVLFFKDGGYAYDGLLGMYLPLAIFFVWVEGMTLAMTRKLKSERALLQAQESIVREAEELTHV